ncbi:MAG: glycosyltransferase family 2 protein [Opitutaceae bacterium]
MKAATEPAGVAVVIPCYRASRRILDVLRRIPAWVETIIVVDDACPEDSGEIVRREFNDPRCRIVRHQNNQGVGGAMCTGFRIALEAGATIVAKIDADGQMAPEHLRELLRPLLEGRADYAKGNRLFDFAALERMPPVRRFGNLGLTLLCKIASGYWGLSDPTNGYVAIHRAALRSLPLDRIDRGYFFECHMLVHLNILRAVVTEVPLPARYGDEKSNLSVRHSLLTFPCKLFRNFVRRVAWRYFIYNMDAVTVFLTGGGLLFFGGLAFGFYRWYLGTFGESAQTPGTVALGLFPALVGFQMLLQAMVLDVMSKPEHPLQSEEENRGA